MLKSFSQIYNDIKNKILERNKNISLHPNSTVNDIFITPQSVELVREIVIADYILRCQSLDLISEMLLDSEYLSLVAFAYGISVDDVRNDIKVILEKHASNFNLTRKGATSATGIIYYVRNNVLTISDGDKTILRGSIVSSTNGQRYEVQSDVTMFAAQGPNYFDPDLNAYSIPVPIKSVNVGIQANAPARTITKMETAVEGFDYVINKDEISNATDEETDETLIERIKLVYLGNNIGTKDGYKKIVLANSNISDVYVSYAGDKFMKRDEGYGGKIDLYILETNIVQQTEIVDTATEYYVLKKQPVDSLISITGHGGAPYLFEANSIEFYEGSIKANARIHWTDFASNPPTVPYTIKYNYNSNVEIIQNLLDKDEYKILAGSDPMVLVKQSIKVPIDISFSLRILSGYSKSSIIQDITNLLTAEISKLKLGESLQQSDIIDLVYTIEGVDSIILPMNKFNRSNLSNVVDTIEVEGREYIRLNNLVIT